MSLGGCALYQAAYMVGSTNKVRIVVPKSPEAREMGIAPQNTLNASGIIPRIAAAAVNKMGRKRIIVA